MSTISPSVYQAVVLARGLRLYAKHGIKPNSQWTPKNMMATAQQITGQSFKPRQYLAAALALDAWVQKQ